MHTETKTKMQRIILVVGSMSMLLVRTEAWMIPNKSIGSVHRLVATRLEEQRRFAQAPNTNNNNKTGNNYNNSDKTPRKFGGDAKLAQKYEERIKTAGRVGTKRFVDPCKVFVGNLPFTVTEDELSRFVLSTMGQSRLVLHSSKVIYDWKTGKSKGYGFVVFTDPIYATVCMEVVNGKTLGDRVVTVDQGKKKDQDNQLYLKKKRKEATTDEEADIASALDEAESNDEDDDGIPVFGGSDEDIELDALLFGLEANDDDDDEGYDGVFLERKPIYEDMDPNLNREQRREAAKRLKRTKLPHKGFG